MVESAKVILEKLVGTNWEILVVDDGSTDSTSSIASNLMAQDPRVKLVSHEINKGFGCTIRTGIENSSKEWIFYTDCDGQFDLNELEDLWERRQGIDIISAYRHKRKDPAMRLAYSFLWNTLTLMLFLKGFKDVDSSFKLFRASIFKKVKPQSTSGVVDFEILTLARNLGYKIIQMPVSHYHRRAGTVSFESVRVGFIAVVKFSAIWEMFQQLLAFRIRVWRGN